MLSYDRLYVSYNREQRLTKNSWFSLTVDAFFSSLSQDLAKIEPVVGHFKEFLIKTCLGLGDMENSCEIHNTLPIIAQPHLL